MNSSSHLFFFLFCYIFYRARLPHCVQLIDVSLTRFLFSEQASERSLLTD